MFLIPDRVDTFKVGAETLQIKVKIIPDGARASKDICSYIRKGDLVKPNAKLSDGSGIVKGITVHNTDNITTAPGTNPAEQYARATYPNGNMAGVVVHYWVYKKEIWQQLNDNERGWHAADGATRTQSKRKGELIGGNLDTIAIECIETGSDSETEDTLAKLVAYLLIKHNLNADTDVYTHNYFYKAKNCPLYILPHWDSFMGTVKRYVDVMKTPTKANEVLYRVQVGAYSNKANAENLSRKLTGEGFNNIIVFDSGLHRVQVGAFANRENAEVLVAKLKAAHYDVYIIDVINKSTAKTGQTPTVPVVSKISEGSRIRIKDSATTYYPHGVTIPGWVKDYDHIVTQTTYKGQPMIKGGKECVLLGEKVNRKTGAREAGINTWISKDNINLV